MALRQDLFAGECLRGCAWKFFEKMTVEFEMPIKAMDRAHSLVEIAPGASVAEELRIFKSAGAQDIHS